MHLIGLPQIWAS